MSTKENNCGKDILSAAFKMIKYQQEKKAIYKPSVSTWVFT